MSERIETIKTITKIEEKSLSLTDVTVMLMQFNALRLMIQYPRFQSCYYLLELYIVIVAPALNDFQWARELLKTFRIEIRFDAPRDGLLYLR
jgi:hypothetical protein